MTGVREKIRSLLLLNLLLQLLDGIITYDRLCLAVAEASPLAKAALVNWGTMSALFYNKILACILLVLIYALRHKREVMAANALTITACVYFFHTSAALIQFWFR